MYSREYWRIFGTRTLVVVLILKLVVLLAIRFSPLLAVLSLEHFLPIGGCCGGTH
jgi:uncharacterized membrane protein YoaK (UPF0700 family)